MDTMQKLDQTYSFTTMASLVTRKSIYPYPKAGLLTRFNFDAFTVHDHWQRMSKPHIPIRKK